MLLKPRTRYVLVTAAGLLTALALSVGAQDGPAISDLDPADCSNGTFVTDPAANPGLVSDCLVLVGVRNHWTRHPNLPSDHPLLTWGRGDTTQITDWDGIYIYDRVERIELSGGISGTIPAELGQLTNLVELSLWDNKLTGPIPTELGQLTNLQGLSLWSNYLTGTLPTELGQLTNLQELGLASNDLTGPIPTELGQLTNLTQLGLWDNKLTGSIPTELGQLTNLQGLGLGGNDLTGPIPTELGRLTNLEWLSMDNNELTGSIPAELGQLTNLTQLSLWDNDLTGSIPTELGRLTNLEWLSLWDNDLTGSIPTELGRLTNLTTLYISLNKLTGSIPAELGQLTNLTQLSLDNNKLTGSIPTELGQLTNLTALFLDNNKLTGSIPAELGQLTNLAHLYLDNNELTGSIPTELGRLTNLEWLSLWDNDLTGSIPAELGRLTNLGHLRCAASTGRFCDDDNIHEPNIETMADWGITLGCGHKRYCPSDNITRTQMAAFLYRAVSQRWTIQAPARAELTDVPADAWYRTYADWVISVNAFTAPGGMFNPDGAVTRADMAIMLIAAFPHLEAVAEPEGLFQDAKDADPAVVRAIEGMYQTGVTRGCSTSPLNYCPDQPVTRAQMASFFVRAINQAGGGS